jgi:hypothetical protein
VKRGAISIIGLKRWFIYRPLAAILAVMVVPMFSPFEGGGVRSSEASAASLATSLSNCPGPLCATRQLIIQNCGIGPICTDLRQLETDAVNGYLGLHHLPPGDAHIIYDYGRTDLRSAIRGQMVNIMGEIIAEPASQRDRHEKNLYDWLQSLVQQNEIAEYKIALDGFLRWQANPCTFVLDPDIARQYGLTYNPLPFCHPSPVSPARQIPDAGYFKLLGFKNSFAKPATSFPYFASLVRDTAVNAAAVWGITAGIYAVVATGVALALAKSFALVLAATGIATASKVAGAVLSTGAVAGLTGVAIVGGVLAIILIAVAIGVTVGIQVFTTQATIDELNGLSDSLAQATNTPPDLNAFATDSTGLGPYKLQATINGQTVPEVPSTAILPVHSDSDLNFAIQKSNETKTSVSVTLAYQDWFGINWSAQTYGGWFVQTCNSGAKCPQADSINANIRYVDWFGGNWTAMRVEDKFISVKNKPSATAIACDPDPITGVSTIPDFTKCKSYYSTSIPLKTPSGVLERVSMSVLPPTAPPVFTSQPTLPFTPGVASRQTITASGTPSPQICVFSSDPPLPPEFSLVGGVCGNNGRLQLAFNGNPDSPQQNYNLTLSAANGTTDGPVLQTFIVDVSRHLGITSPGALDGTAGLPVNFLVTTTGFPPPSLSISGGLLDDFPGLTFTDHGNGTGTIGGTSTVYGTVGCLIGGCVVASNSQGTVRQVFIINLAPAPSASLGPLTEATFVAGADNTVVVTSTGAKTRVGWRVTSKPPWTDYDDNENGTLTLSGMPPAGTSGTFSVLLTPVAEGSYQLANPPPPSTYLLKVVNTPLFTSPNTARFTVGSAGSFAVSANEGKIDLIGPLSKGLSFTGGNPARISGNPVAGSGGQYQLALRDVVRNQVSVYQNLVLNVDEAPMITSSNKATFPTGFPGLFTVTTTGFPSVSSQVLKPPLSAPTSPTQGKGMYFTVTGLPASLKASNLNPQGFATGTLTIQGTPLLADAGSRQVQITAHNGVGATAQQTLTLNIVKLIGLVPSSGTTCDGAYIGVFDGFIEVTPGQNCMFVGGGVTGNVRVLGGDFTLSGAKVTGNVLIQGSSEFFISAGSEVGGILSIQDVSTMVSRNTLCGTTIGGNLDVGLNAIPIEIGSAQASCTGNSIDGFVNILDNTGPIGVYNNRIAKTLNCAANLSIIGRGNSAEAKTGQCAGF